MSLLDKITGGTKMRPRRTMVYGPHGVGKSTFGSESYQPIFVPTEDGADDIDCKKCFEFDDEGNILEGPLRSFERVMYWLGELYTAKHDYATVVVDSADWLEKLIWQAVCKDRKVECIEDIGYGKGYTFALLQWRQFLDGLEALRNDRNMSVILLAHANIEKFNNPETESYDRYSPRLHKLASHLLQEWCDEVLFATYKVHVTKTDEGFNKQRARGVGSNERILRTTERPAHVAKNRLKMPDEIEFKYAEYAKYFTAA